MITLLIFLSPFFVLVFFIQDDSCQYFIMG